MAGTAVLQMFRNALRIAADEDAESPQSRTVDLQVGRTVHTVSGSMRTELWLSVLTRNRGAGHAAAREYGKMLARVRSRRMHEPFSAEQLSQGARLRKWAALPMQPLAFDSMLNGQRLGSKGSTCLALLPRQHWKKDNLATTRPGGSGALMGTLQVHQRLLCCAPGAASGGGRLHRKGCGAHVSARQAVRQAHASRTSAVVQ